MMHATMRSRSTPSAWRSSLVLVLAGGLAACSHQRPGTFVELRDKDGQDLYIAGAAVPGVNKDVACRGAVVQAVGAIADKFADQNDSIADEIAQQVGAESGNVFLARYAKATADASLVPDVRYDPADHVCYVTVTWQAPIFLKDALLKYAEGLKAKEQAQSDQVAGTSPAAADQGSGQGAPPASAVSATPSGQGASVSTVTVTTDTSGSTTVTVTQGQAAGPGSAPAQPPPPAETCVKEKSALRKAQAALKTAEDEQADCLRRTQNNQTTCHRYQLYLDQAQAKESSAAKDLQRCQAL